MLFEPQNHRSIDILVVITSKSFSTEHLPAPLTRQFSIFVLQCYVESVYSIRAVERGQGGTEYPGQGFFRGSALLSNAMRIGFGCNVFSIDFSNFRPAQEISHRYGD